MPDREPLITGLEWNENDFQSVLGEFHEQILSLAKTQFPLISFVDGGSIIEPYNSRRRYYLTARYGQSENPSVLLDFPIGIIVDPYGIEKVLTALKDEIEKPNG